MFNLTETLLWTKISLATSNFYQKLIISLSKKSLIQFQTEDNNLGELVAVVRSFRYIYTNLHLVRFELWSLRPQAEVLPIEPPLLVNKFEEA